MDALYAAVIVYAIYSSKSMTPQECKKTSWIWNGVIALLLILEIIKLFEK